MLAQEKNTGRMRHLRRVEARDFVAKGIKEAEVVGGRVLSSAKKPEQETSTTRQAD